jgi:hypothetical protein
VCGTRQDIGPAPTFDYSVGKSSLANGYRTRWVQFPLWLPTPAFAILALWLWR